MPEIIFNGPDGRLEGRYVQKATEGKPMAMILHPLPQLGGNMNNPVTYQLYQTFLNRGFTVLRFNFRGVGEVREVLITELVYYPMQPLRWIGFKVLTLMPSNAG